MQLCEKLIRQKPETQQKINFSVITLTPVPISSYNPHTYTKVIWGCVPCCGPRLARANQVKWGRPFPCCWCTSSRLSPSLAAQDGKTIGGSKPFLPRITATWPFGARPTCSGGCTAAPAWMIGLASRWSCGFRYCYSSARLKAGMCVRSIACSITD